MKKPLSKKKVFNLFFQEAPETYSLATNKLKNLRDVVHPNWRIYLA